MLMSGRVVLVGTFLFWRKVFHISHHGSFWKPNIQETPLSTLVFQGVSCICILKLHMDGPDVQPGLKSLCAPETLTCLQIPWGCFLKLGSDSRGLGGAWESAFPTSALAMPTLPIPRPHLKYWGGKEIKYNLNHQACETKHVCFLAEWDSQGFSCYEMKRASTKQRSRTQWNSLGGH